MFIGRRKELEELNQLFHSQKFEFILVYGARHVGKTSFLQEFATEKNAIYYTALETSPAENLSLLSVQIRQKISDNSADEYGTYKSVFDEILEEAKQRRIVLIIDDYQFLSSSYKGMNALLQYYVEERFRDSRLMLVLGVSSMLFAHNEFLSEKGDFFQMLTHSLEIKPFDFFETRDYLLGFSPQDIGVLYGVTGGIPRYLKKMNGLVNLRENIMTNILNVSADMFYEPLNVIRRETREPVFYNGILSAIASGYVKNAAIADRVELQTSACTAYLNNLISLGIVKRERPVAEKSRKKTIYSIEDGYMRFWYSFIPQNLELIQKGEGDKAWDIINSGLNDFMKQTFREICMQWLKRENDAGTLPIGFTSMGAWWGGAEQARRKVNEIDTLKQWLMRERAVKSLPLDTANMGRWWGSATKRRSDDEIDIIAPAEDDQSLFGICRWAEYQITKQDIDGLIEKSSSFDVLTKFLFLFSREGFSPDCLSEAERLGNLILISYERIFGS